jgi:hypothetical protein
VRIVVGFAPATGADILARLMGQWLSDRLGQQFVIENRPGAGTNIATEAVVHSAPDGYTLLAVSPANAINALYEKLNFNFIQDIAPVASVMRTPNVMLVNPSVPAKSVPEFIAYTKANPGKISFASAGNGSGSHMSGELFKMMTGVDIWLPPPGGAAGHPPGTADSPPTFARLPELLRLKDVNECSSLARTSSLSSLLSTSRSMGKSGRFRHRTLQRVMICRDAISSQCCSVWRQAES